MTPDKKALLPNLFKRQKPARPGLDPTVPTGPEPPGSTPGDAPDGAGQAALGLAMGMMAAGAIGGLLVAGAVTPDDGDASDGGGDSE